MKKSIVILGLGLMISAGAAHAQEQEIGKHELRIGVSDATPVVIGTGIMEGLGNAVISGITGAKIKDSKTKTLGMFEFGYRYQATERIKLGADISYLKTDHTFKTTVGAITSLDKRKTQYLMVLPTAEFAYINTPLFTFYGTAAAGLIGAQIKDTSEGNKGYKNNTVGFAFQVNPIAFRLGKKLGVFAEFGYGYKGIATGGISYRF